MRREIWWELTLNWRRTQWILQGTGCLWRLAVNNVDEFRAELRAKSGGVVVVAREKQRGERSLCGLFGFSRSSKHRARTTLRCNSARKPRASRCLATRRFAQLASLDPTALILQCDSDGYSRVSRFNDSPVRATPLTAS